MAAEASGYQNQNQNVQCSDSIKQRSSQELPLLQETAFGADHSMESWLTKESILSPLLIEYDKHLEEMSERLRYCQGQMGEMKLKLGHVTKENERLHEELKEVIEKQLEALPSGSPSGDVVFMDKNLVRNLEEQLQLTNNEKERAVELWQAATQELERLQQIFHKQMTEAQIHIAESHKQKGQFTSFQQLTKQLHLANEKAESINQVFLKTVQEQNVELEQLRKQLRQSKSDLRTAVAKVDEMTRLIENSQNQMDKKEEDVRAAREKEEASDKRLQQLQTSIKQLETRLCITTKDSEELRAEATMLKNEISELHMKCAALEQEKYDAVIKIRESMQHLEEANLQKTQAMVAEKQKEEEIANMKEAISQLWPDAASRTRKEVENERKRCNIQISRLTEELSALQMECGDKQAQIERAVREKRATEEELEKVYSEGRGNESDDRKLEELYQRCLSAERAKDDLERSLQTALNKIRQLEVNHEEKLGRSQEMIQKLQRILDSERENCGSVSEERLKLQQESERLQKEIEDLRKLTMEAQQTAKLKISTMENEFLIKEHGYEVRLKEMEDVNQNSTAELRRLLIAQQKATNRWKEETKKLTENTETRISNLKSELSRQKINSQELLCQLERANKKIIENEKLMMEHQEKVNRLQRRLSQAEERAATASQQLSTINTQRKKAVSLIELENI
ncbi:sodium channel and clathrin linker 1 [Paroedura picta]|uniref:sodium channel and clathrin linker 1 n=1 Tax=Paroedura picta TaxID=143630 RepID=UPI004056BBD9